MQSFSQKGLKFLGRIHSVKDNLKALNYILKAGFKNFSLDFIFGWKGQGEKTLKKEILKALKFNPSHLSFYELTLEKETPFYEYRIKIPNPRSMSRALTLSYPLLYTIVTPFVFLSESIRPYMDMKGIVLKLDTTL